MLLTLLKPADAPATQAGVRSLLAFWVGGAALAATATISGAASVTAPAPTVAATGTVPYHGAASVSVPAPTVSATGVKVVRGSGAVSAPAPTVSATGRVVGTGTAAVSTPAPTVSAAGTIPVTSITGTGAVTVPAPTVSATGSGGIGGEIDPTEGFPYAVLRTFGKYASNATSRTLSLPTHTAGQLLMSVVSVDGVVTITPSAGWTALTRSETTVTSGVFWKIATSSSETLTVTFSAAEQVSWISTAYANAGKLYSASSTGSSTNSDPPALDAPEGFKKYLWVATRTGDAAVQPTAPPTGYANWTSQEGGSGAATTDLAERELETAGTENPGPWTVATEQWVCWTLALSPDKTLIAATPITRDRAFTDPTVVAAIPDSSISAESFTRSRTFTAPTVSQVVRIAVKFSGTPTKIRRDRAFTVPAVTASDSGTQRINITETVTRSRTVTAPAVTPVRNLIEPVLTRARTLTTPTTTYVVVAATVVVAQPVMIRVRTLPAPLVTTRSTNAPVRRHETSIYIYKEVL